MERFLVYGQGLRWMRWEDAEALSVRVKTSLVLTRHRSRQALSSIGLFMPDAYALGYLAAL